MNQVRLRLLLILVAASILIACRTIDIIDSAASNASAQPTVAADDSSNVTNTAEPRGTRDPNTAFDFVPAEPPRCKVGEDSASIVQGKITSKGQPVVGQAVQASSGRGGEPITDVPAMTDKDGNFQVNFVCDGKACDGSFWVWLIDKDKVEISPFVEFIFDNDCRIGTLNFRKR